MFPKSILRVALLIICLFPLVVFGDPGDGGGDPFDDGDPGAPLDSGVYVLVVAGIILGALRIRRNQITQCDPALEKERRKK